MRESDGLGKCVGCWLRREGGDWIAKRVRVERGSRPKEYPHAGGMMITQVCLGPKVRSNWVPSKRRKEKRGYVLLCSNEVSWI